MQLNPQKILHCKQGEIIISAEKNTFISTILGSCVSAFIIDPFAKVGGINHFLLPDTHEKIVSIKYGINAMEQLINMLISNGARKEKMIAKLFGGATMIPGLSDIGKKNSDFAELYLKEEGITYSGGSLGGNFARKIRASPSTGIVQQMRIERKINVLPSELKTNNAFLF